jgi:error-prone DNA polymerase
MGYFNPNISWSELERRLSGGATPEDILGRDAYGEPIIPHPPVTDVLANSSDEWAGADGGDSPAWSRKRAAYQPPAGVRPPVTSTVDYAELHCHTNFSFLDGASQPEELVEEAVQLGLSALAVTDHDGFYGVVRFNEAAREWKLPAVFGTELSLDLPGPQNGEPDPVGRHLLVLARGPEGYARMSRTLTEAHLAGGEKGKPVYDVDEVAGALRDHALVLTGCRKGPVPAALLASGMDAAATELDRLVALFGHDNVAVELTRRGDPLDDDICDALATLADGFDLPTVATGNVHYATPKRRSLATALAAVRARRSLDEMDGWLPAAATAHLRSGDEMAALYAAYPGAVARAAAYGRDLAFDLQLVSPQLPAYPVPAGHTEMTWMRQLTMDGARQRYGERGPDTRKQYDQIDYELDMIEKLDFPGYFLVVYDIVKFCKDENIYCQGRGSAANSAVCYALGITNVDAVRWNLLFERFLAPERDGPPDIDIDIESDRREEVIQHVYRKYGRRHTAQVANVISYRPRSAVRDIAKAMGFSPGQQDAWSKGIDHWGALSPAGNEEIPAQVVACANEVATFPRHLGIHSGGMVICDRPVIEVCPVEWARMENRSVLQWDKDDCAATGLVKFDLLGLGMLSALHYAFDMIDTSRLAATTPDGRSVDLSTLALDDDEIYEMLCRADSIGVFQVESRAQMATLPRLKPRKFYDLVVEVALIRPGPIQGGSVHPYIRRKNGLEEPDIPHEKMRNALDKTLGVPLFQEQLMQLAIDVADFTPAEADQLRRAMGSKRSTQRMQRIRTRLYDGMAANGITGALADDIFVKLAAFANYGFPESHAMSFAYLVYASAWLKRYHPAAFCAALINAQPMGFYSVQTLVDDARRHGVTVLRPDINASNAKATLERPPGSREASTAGEPPASWGVNGPRVRLGLSSVRTLGIERSRGGEAQSVAARIEAERNRGAPYRDMADLARRARLSTTHLEALATADAFTGFGLTRREALWAAGAAAQEKAGRLPGTTTGLDAPMLPGMDAVDELVADVWATGLSPECHPVQFIRGGLDKLGALSIEATMQVEHGKRVFVGGIVTHRQRPATASGITFMNLEDETGLLNIVCSPGLWQRFRRVAQTSPALLIRGRIERYDGVVNLNAEHLAPLRMPVRTSSRDFR